MLITAACNFSGEGTCQNGGVCVVSTDQVTGEGRRSCICPRGTSGAFCEWEGVCNLQCRHGGSCRHYAEDDGAASAEKFACECLAGYKGAECEIPFTTCPQGPNSTAGECLWGGTCVGGGDEGGEGEEVRCKCPRCRSGDSCEEKLAYFLQEKEGPDNSTVVENVTCRDHPHHHETSYDGPTYSPTSMPTSYSPTAQPTGSPTGIPAGAPSAAPSAPTTLSASAIGQLRYRYDVVGLIVGTCLEDADCANGGLCVLARDAADTASTGMHTKRARCLCALGWGGDTCERPCWTLGCQHGSSCRFAPAGDSPRADADADAVAGAEDGAYCDCDDAHYTGAECEIQVQKCPGPGGVECLHGGACVAKGSDPASGVYVCACPRGRTGPRCEARDGTSGDDDNAQVAASQSDASQTASVPKEGIDPVVFILAVVAVALLLLLPATVAIVKRSNRREREVEEQGFIAEGEQEQGDDHSVS